MISRSAQESAESALAIHKRASILIPRLFDKSGVDIRFV